MRHGCRNQILVRARSRAVAPRCAAMVAGGIATIVLVASVSVPALADPVSPWATGGAQTKPGDNDGKPSGARIAQVPVSQAHAMPGTVVQGGAIPQGWQPQAVPYQAVGPDGRPVTMYYAPTYVFTYPIGPSIAAPAPTRSPLAVNRRQAYGQPAANGWNYQTQGAIPPPVYALPPSTTARYQPVPYQFPAGANALGGTPLLPPTSAKPAAATPQFPPQFPPPSQRQSPPLPPNSLSPPPTQWVPASPDALPDSSVPAQPVSSVPSLSGDSAPPNPTASRAANAHLWRVVGVYDGDTITCIDDTNTQQKIRMAEIDAPELGQDFGTVSREAMAAMVFGKTVDVTDSGKDRYGRWIGHISVNGLNVNREMIATGNAWHYAAYSSDPSLAAVQSQAQTQKLGLWAQPNPTPPWNYRKNGTNPAPGN